MVSAWSDSSTDFCHLENVLISDIPILFRGGRRKQKKKKEEMFIPHYSPYAFFAGIKVHLGTLPVSLVTQTTRLVVLNPSMIAAHPGIPSCPRLPLICAGRNRNLFQHGK